MKFALISLDQCWEDKETNQERVLNIMKVLPNDINLVIFPEMTLTGYTLNTALAEQEESSPSIIFFTQLAQKYNVAIIFGLAIQRTNGVYNDCLFINEEGAILQTYQKIHPFSFAKENEHYQSGQNLASVTYFKHNLGLTICYDLRFPEVYTALAQSNDIIINIANWPAKRFDHWYTLLKARAIENQTSIIAVNRIGSDGNKMDYKESSYFFNANGEEQTPLFVRPVFDKNKPCAVMKIFANTDFDTTFKQRFNTVQDRKTKLYQQWLNNID